MKPIAPAPLALRESRWQRRFLWFLHGLAALTAAALPQPWLLLALGWVGASYCRTAWPAPQLCELAWLEDGQLSWRFDDGRQGAGRLLPGSLLTAHFCLLLIQTEAGLLRCPIWPDRADSQSLRRWRIYLRWKISEQQGNQQG